MKALKKMLSVLMAAAMVMVMAVPAMAADGSGYTITIKNAAEGHTYQAYQIFAGDLSTDGKTLSNIQWGSGVTEAGQTYFGNAADKAKNVTTTELAQAFAKDVATYLQTPITSGEYDASAKTYTISGLQPGYYLVKDKDNTLAGADDAYTAYIMEVVDNVDVTPKSDKPTLDKQIKHNEGDNGNGTWGVVGDNQIGDEVEFRTITTVPDTTGYGSYNYVIHDTMSEGLTSNVVTNNTNGNVTIKVNDGTVLTPDYYTVEANGNTFSITVKIKEAITAGVMKAGDSLYTYYSGVLNEDAKVYDEDKQDNTAYLEYSNNPNNTEDKGRTPDKTVYDWTFKMEINKVDGSDKTKKLAGAQFSLSENGSLTDGSLEETALIKLIDNNDGTYTVAPADYDGETTTTIVTVDNANVTIKGLDDETKYYLYETKAPDGYNRLTTPVEFAINADTTSYGTDGSTKPTVTINVAGTAQDNTTATIVNNAGSTLPSTGGRGTRLFYIVGGVIVVAAAVLLIVKKRMKSNG